MVDLADAPLLGRSTALAHISRAITRVRAGAGSFLWVSGEAGIGKTSLLDAAAITATAQGLRVLRGTAWDSPGTPPFWLWVQVLRDAADRGGREELLARWGARSAEALSLLPELALADAPIENVQADPDRFALFDAVEGILAAVAAEEPLMLLLDDLHWTDAGSLRLLRFLTRSPSTTPVVVVASWRDEESVGESLAALARELIAHSERIQLAGLERDAVAELLAAKGELQVDEDQAERLRVRTSGNPLFIVELALLARDRGNADVTALVPASAEAIIGRRLARISQACHEVLAVAAIAGKANSLDTVTLLAHRDPADVVAAVDEAVAAGLARAMAGRVEIAHPLIRDCLVRSIPPARAREVHLAIADLTPDEPTAAAEAAHHRCAALPLGDIGRAREAVARAADVAYAARAYEEAVQHRTVELDLAGTDPRLRCEAMIGRGTALLAVGAVDEARDDYVHAAELARARGDSERFARAALGFATGLSGFEVRLRDRTQISLLEEALEMLGGETSSMRADVMARLSVALSFEGVAERRVALADAAVELARQVGSPRSIAHALAAHCDAIAGPDEVGRRRAEAGEVIELAQRSGDRAVEMLGLRLRIVALLETGATTAARADIRLFTELAEAVGQPLYRCYVPIFHGFLAHLEGDLPAMAAHAQEIDHWGALSGSMNAGVLAATMRGWLVIEEGRVEDFMGLFVPFLGDISQLGPNGDAVMSLMPGQPDEMRLAAAKLLPEIVERMSRDSEFLSTLAVLGAGLREHGGPLEAAGVLRAAMLPYSGCFAVDGIAAGAAGAVDRWIGFADLLLGNIEEAIDHLERAVTFEDGLGARLGAAHGRAHLADAYARRAGPGDASRSAHLAAEARAAYLALGLTRRAEALVPAPAQPSTAPPRSTGAFVRDGDVWRLEFRGSAAVVRHVKGMADLATLLRSPGQEVHALDLAGAGRSRQGGTGPVLDDRAKAAYGRRLDELAEELAAADSAGDADAFARADAERAFLLAELGAAYGLGGRSRRTGDDAERARSAVTWRIRDAIKRIERAHPEAGAHLRKAVRTGAFCAYDPDGETTWEVSALTP